MKLNVPYLPSIKPCIRYKIEDFILGFGQKLYNQDFEKCTSI